MCVCIMSRLPPRPPLPSVSLFSPPNSSSQPPRAPFTVNAEALGDAGEMDVAVESTWLQPFQRTWEEVTEDESGLLVSTSLQQQKQRKAAILVDPPLIVSKGVIRALVLVIDFSAAMALTDLKPSRRLLTLSLLSTFITDYFDQNPLSQLSIVLGHRGVGVRVTELSGHPNEQLRVLRERCERLLVEEEKAQRQGTSAAAAGGGSFSLQNCLEMSRSTLTGVPSYAAREVLCIVASLSTVDASDISTSVAALKQHHITANVIHLAAELYVCTNLCQQTGGRHGVVLNKEHYQTLLRSHLPPTPSAAQSATSATRRWMRMGFPQQLTTPYPLLCSCHTLLTYTAFQCPHCLSRYCELPTQCNVCSLQLVSSPQLARTYHHLFPSPVYRMREEVHAGGEVCRGCGSMLVSGEDVVCECSECGEAFCIDCDEFVHSVLHHCPGCNGAYRAKVEEGVEKVEDGPTKKEVEREVRVKTEPIVLD